MRSWVSTPWYADVTSHVQVALVGRQYMFGLLLHAAAAFVFFQLQTEYPVDEVRKSDAGPGWLDTFLWCLVLLLRCCCLFIDMDNVLFVVKPTRFF